MEARGGGMFVGETQEPYTGLYTSVGTVYPFRKNTHPKIKGINRSTMFRVNKRMEKK